MLTDVLVGVASLPVSLANVYLWLLTVFSARAPAPKYGAPRRRFAVVVPAHDEEAGIAATVKNLLCIDYPKDMFSVVVVADNCSDGTAELAAASGARVLVRHDDKLRGKGYALLHAFTLLAPEVDALVVVDADTIVSPNLLAAFSARLAAGADVVQADYAVRNPDASWRTRLMAIAFGAFHVLRSAARERLRVSSGLRGNGMCFTSKILSVVPYDAFSVVEDIEYGVRLGEAGQRVHYAGEAHVYGEMVSGERASRSQRSRWERGRTELAHAHAFPLMRRALARRDWILADLAADLWVPPLGTLAAATMVGLAAALLVRYAEGGSIALAIWTANLAVLLAYVLRGWSLSKTGLRGLLGLVFAPLYVAWKIWLRLRQPRNPSTWVRTAREPQDAASPPPAH
jgi:cellulose synthase/poly-beta-1,6-N-acetylglucosamine synthase-like glycosyltransferase